MKKSILLILSLIFILSCSKENKPFVNKIYFEQKEIQLELGKQLGLSIIEEPKGINNLKYEWTSNANDVVSVNNGNISAKKIGNAIITAINKEFNLTANILVTVIYPTPNKLSIISDKNSINIKETLQLNFNIEPDNIDLSKHSIIWSVDNNNIATINQNGQLVGVNEGVVEVSAKITNTSISSSLKINVKHIDVESVTNKRYGAYIEVNQEYNLLNDFNFSPIDYTRLPVFSAQKTDVVSINNGIMKGVKGGQSSIMLTGTNGKQYPINYSVTVLDLQKVEFNKEFTAPNGLTVVVRSLTRTGSSLIVDYYIKNNTTSPIGEGGFSVRVKDGFINQNSYPGVLMNIYPNVV